MSKQLNARSKSLSIVINTFILNSDEVIKDMIACITEIDDFVNQNYIDHNPIKLPTLEQKHIDLMNVITCRIVNYLSSYKTLLEVVDSISNTFIKEGRAVPQAVSDFINFTNSSPFLKWCKFNDASEDGLLVILRNFFTHDVISPFLINATCGGKPSLAEWVVAVKHERPNDNAIQILLEAQKRMSENPKATIMRYDGKQWKHRVVVDGVINVGDQSPKMKKELSKIIQLEQDSFAIASVITHVKEIIDPYLIELKNMIKNH